jgi:NAD+-dependent secondary alcohol dehydrogenase Adh1
VITLPPGVQPADVAAHADAGLTAYHAVKKASAMGLLFPGSRTVVIGAGGLGHIGIQALKATTPTEVIVVDRSEEALALAERYGADHTVVANGGQVDAVLELTDGQGAQAVIDFVGEGGATARGFAMLRRAGGYFVIGYGEHIDVPTIDIISTERSFVGNLVGTYNDLVELMTLAGQGKVMLHPDVRTRGGRAGDQRLGEGPAPRSGHPRARQRLSACAGSGRRAQEVEDEAAGVCGGFPLGEVTDTGQGDSPVGAGEVLVFPC